VSRWFAAVAVAAIVLLVGRRTTGRTRLLGVATEPSRGRVGWRHVLIGASLVGSALVAAGASPWLVAAVAGSAAAARVARRRQEAVRAHAEREAACVELAVALAGELRAGRSGREALEAVAVNPGPLQPDLRAAAIRAVTGTAPSRCLAEAAARTDAARLASVAAVWSVAESVGGQVAVVLDRLAESMDADDRLRGEVAAELAGPRATVAVLAALPLLGLLLGQSVGAHPLHLLLHRRGGWVLLAAAAGFDLAGVALMRAITRRAVPP
jgi:tight adherence protein B